MPPKLPHSKPLRELGGEGGKRGITLSKIPGEMRIGCRGEMSFLFVLLPLPPFLPSPSPNACVCLSETELSVENGPGTPSCVGIRSWGTWGGVRLLAYFHIH